MEPQILDAAVEKAKLFRLIRWLLLIFFVFPPVGFLLIVGGIFLGRILGQ